MIATFIALATAPLLQAGAPEPQVHHYRSFNVHAAHAAGCHVSQVHLPVGKPGQTPAVIRCPAPVKALESGWRGREERRGR